MEKFAHYLPTARRQRDLIYSKQASKQVSNVRFGTSCVLRSGIKSRSLVDILISRSAIFF